MYTSHFDPADDAENPPAGRLIQFSIQRKDVAVSASVTPEYFEARVLPVINSLLDEIAESAAAPAAPEPVPAPEAEPVFTPPPAPAGRRETVRTIAERLEANTGTDILRAAAIAITVLRGNVVFTREDLLAEATKAAGYWRKSHAKDAPQLIEYLLSRDILVETADGKLTLNPKEEKLAQEMFEKTSA